MISSLKSSNYFFLYSNPNFKELGFYLQELSTPTITLGEIPYNNSTGTLYIVGDTLTYGELSVRVIVDENLTVYTSILEEILRHKDMENNTIDLTNYTGTAMFTSNKGNPIFSMTYQNCFINSIGSLVFNENQEDTPIFVDVTFRFTDMKYERLTSQDVDKDQISITV